MDFRKSYVDIFEFWSVNFKMIVLEAQRELSVQVFFQIIVCFGILSSDEYVLNSYVDLCYFGLFRFHLIPS